ncbi:MAG: DegV family protein [Erysipelotrichaceae bacterium]|nr:DegV family protein [Erysipelotrichaceae bacterium]
MAKYKIITDSCSDLDAEMRKKYDVDYYPMGLVIDGRDTIADLDWKEFTIEEFYQLLKDHHKVKTSLISVETVTKVSEKYLKEGYDILYLGCSTALTASINSYNLAKEELLEKYPGRRMESASTFLASCGLAMLIEDVCKARDAGASLDEAIKVVEDRRFFYNQFCTVDTLTYLKENGRIKAGKAFFGNLMGVKPIFISDRKGNNLVVTKAKGTKGSLDTIFNMIKDAIDLSKDDRVWITHALCPERVEILKKRFEEELGTKNITICKMGPIIGTTCGPATIAAFCYGKEVTRYEGDGQD